MHFKLFANVAFLNFDLSTYLFMWLYLYVIPFVIYIDFTNTKSSWTKCCHVIEICTILFWWKLCYCNENENLKKKQYLTQNGFHVKNETFITTRIYLYYYILLLTGAVWSMCRVQKNTNFLRSSAIYINSIHLLTFTHGRLWGLMGSALDHWSRPP